MKPRQTDDMSVLSDAERAALAARRRLLSKGIQYPSRARLAKEAGLSVDRLDQAESLLRACGLLAPSPRQADGVYTKHRNRDGLVDKAGRLAITRRLAIVRNAKWRKSLAGGYCWLDPEELDAILPPIECRRTRDRLMKGDVA
jgi:hypothetical protein